ncbi:hypothetical protein EJ04DRAFT_506292 [Polyplosphaeria fusca]|uniref:Rhodopsin domain-containing protein n=1 Tax=Polyplosphaeria fusca TaxID=682080 RepID=A0A9P4UVR7_9PLEO|nr:hypothetical protein EJ04DRAFT_506292 [Polyplosphaeria fusca]
MTGHGSPEDGKQPDQYASLINTPLMGVAISLPIIATFATGLRFYARRNKGDGKYRLDDWFILITLVFCWAHSINTIIGACIGGIDRIVVSPQEYSNIALRMLWVSSFFLVTALYTVKVSILMFYHHLFSIKRPFRIAVFIMLGIITSWWISSVVCIFAASDPISANWKNAAGARHRFDYNNWYVSYSGLSVLFDVVILCFPIPMVKALHVDFKKKIYILGIFWLGAFVCIAAIIRFETLYRSIYHLGALGQNRYSTLTEAYIWAAVEPNVAVIAACLPTYGPLFAENGVLTPVVRSIKGAFSMSRGTARGSRTAAGAKAVEGSGGSSGYYELDKTLTSNKSSGDIFQERTGLTIELRKDITVDVEAQKTPLTAEMDRYGVQRGGRSGVPPAYFPR